MSHSCKRILAALAFVLPMSALVLAPAAQAASQKAKTHSSSIHKASAHKSSHKKHTTTTPPAS